MAFEVEVEEVGLVELDRLLEDFESGKESLLIPLLQKAQRIYGYLSPPVLDRVAEHLKIPVSRVYEVATFYTQFHLTPHGRNTIRVCRGTACHIKGGESILEAVEEKLGIKDGETTDDLEFSLETVACLGTCFLSPVMMINERYYGKLTPKKVIEILEQHKVSNGG